MRIAAVAGKTIINGDVLRIAFGAQPLVPLRQIFTAKTFRIRFEITIN